MSYVHPKERRDSSSEVPVKFDLTKPCSSCPFRTDVPFYLHPGRAKEIAEALLAGQTFQCHKTVPYDRGAETDDGETTYPVLPDAQHCAGAAIMLEHMGQPNQWMQVCERMGWRDPKALDLDAPVFRTAAEFIAAMRRQDRGL